MLADLVVNAQVFLLIFVRVLALIETAPLLSSDSIPQIAKVGLGFFAAATVFPWINQAGYPLPDEGMAYLLLVIGEAMVGVVLGFFLTLIYTAFQLAGQFYSLQIGFGASETFDPLSQIEIPEMGQLLNLIAMFVFLVVDGFQKLFFIGVYRSFGALTAADLVAQREGLVKTVLGGLGGLFVQALVISFPILGTLFLVSVALGLLAKAAPQMNLLMMGFPISLGVAFLIILVLLPFMAEAFARVIDGSFDELLRIIEGRT